jgi:hypothetical protein
MNSIFKGNDFVANVFRQSVACSIFSLLIEIEALKKIRLRITMKMTIKRLNQEIKNTIWSDGAFEFFHNQAANR